MVLGLFWHGKYRIYELAEVQKKEYTGKKIDGIEIWKYPYRGDTAFRLTEPIRYSNQCFVKGYNGGMRKLLEEENETVP